MLFAECRVTDQLLTSLVKQFFLTALFQLSYFYLLQQDKNNFALLCFSVNLPI